MDLVVFKLFELANMTATYNSFDKANFVMEAAYSFVNLNKWFFTQENSTAYYINYLGVPQPDPGPSVFAALTNLQYLKSEGKNESTIGEKAQSYWKTYSCAAKTNTTLSNLMVAQIKVIPPKSPLASAKPKVQITYIPYFKYVLDHYSSVLQEVVREFKVYMNEWISRYDKGNF